MCGICGELKFDRGQRVSEDALASMVGAICHRGPDHGATFMDPGHPAALGFRRLSIIDLRAAGNQPIGNEDGSVQLVFNGEIYNYREIREQLVASGHVFRSNADSEVIVHLYEERGESAIDALDGMFALAIWDRRHARLTLARDRAGKKPLFVWHDATRVVFASEIKSLLAHPELAIEIDETAVPSYFLYGYVPHPQTFYRNISHVEPGTVTVFEHDGRRADRKYWQLTFPRADDIGRAAPSFDEARAQVRTLVTAAVERRLMSDVPLGAFLSGGIDSTVVVGVMARLMKEPVRTFSIGFEGEPVFDETDVARQTARHFGTSHVEFRVRPSAVDLLDRLVYHHDGPFADSSAVPTYLVSKLTREHVTVALTGDGGDEVFAGYLRFGAAVAAERVPRWTAGLAAGVLAVLPSPRNERQLVARGRRFTRFMHLPLDDRLTAWTSLFYDDLEELLEPSLLHRTGAVDRRRHIRGLAGAEGATALGRVLAINFHSYLHDDLLVKADRMSMATSLEARAPLLDRALMDYVARLPDSFKLRGRRTKIVLRAAFDDLIPEMVKQQGKKGFGVPLDRWFRGELRDLAHDTLLAPSARLRTYVSQPFVARLLANHGTGTANHGHKIWALLTFERWLQLMPGWTARRGDAAESAAAGDNRGALSTRR
jgi:asparagine synthase (glutamine-hydrolysing)